MDPITPLEYTVLNGYGSASELGTERLAELLELQKGRPYLLMVHPNVSDVVSMGVFVKAYGVQGDHIFEGNIPGRYMKGRSTVVQAIAEGVVDSDDGPLAVFRPIIEGQASTDTFCTYPVELLAKEGAPLIVDFDEVPDFTVDQLA